jgi:multiple sugar transport system ATP-binding protein
MATIEYRGLTKVFPGGAVAVDSVDLDIPDGEFVVLVGPSGSGKTTVLRMTAGLEDPTSGEILIGGEDVTGIAPMDRDVAMVFQSYALYPHMTVFENMAFALKLHHQKKPEIKKRVEAAAQMLGIADLLKRKPGQLSGGQRQRVAMGRAIVRDPAAFLMDEPLSNLDAKLRVEMRSYIGMLHQQLRTTTLYVTHDQIEAMTMGDRVAVMREGRIEQVDEPQVLYDRPVNLFVAGFIGSPAMNLVRSQLVAEDDAVYALFGPTKLRIPDAVLAQRKSLREHVGKEVILGVRPEDIEDAALVPGLNGDSRTLDVTVSLAEALGAEVVAHFPVTAEPVLVADAVADALQGSDAGEPSEYLRLVAATPSGQATLTARLAPRTAARTGAAVRLAVDTERLHFFDPETELAIW